MVLRTWDQAVISDYVIINYENIETGNIEYLTLMSELKTKTAHKPISLI